jgi:hypothetical protein
MDDPPISTYDKNYGLAEKNSLFDAAEGGRRNNIQGLEFKARNQPNIFSNYAQR